MSDDQQKTALFHEFSGGKSQSGVHPKSYLLFFIVIILGIGAGYFLSNNKQMSAHNGMSTQSQNSTTVSVVKGTVIGSNDTNTFKDTAEGVLQKGGINGEGQYHLVRPGGDSQNVYLTSSFVDLSQFVGHKIKVNGQTNSAKTAGWLMDVGRVEVLE